MESPSGQKIRAWSRLAALGVSGIALTLVLRRLDLQALGETLRHVQPGWFVVANLTFALAFALAAVRWHLMLRLNRLSVHAGATFRLVFIGQFFNTLLFGPAGGDLAKAHLYSRWFGHPLPLVLSTCVLDRLTGGAGFILFAFLTAILAVLGEIPGLNITWLNSSTLLVFCLVAAFLGLGIGLLRRSFWRISRLRQFAETLRSDGRLLLAHPSIAWQAVLLSFLSHIFISVVLLFCLKSVAQTSFELVDLLWVFPVIKLFSAVPITIAGAGVREGAALVMLGMYGIPAADAVAAALLVFLVYLVWAAIGGALAWRDSHLLERQVRHPSPTSLSAVIPTLNEAETLGEAIRHLKEIPEISEIIVVDGGSSDRTLDLARRLGCICRMSPAGRGAQMRVGAAAATGDVILLVHADTWLPEEGGRAVLDCLRDQTVVAGGFWKVFRRPRLLMRGSRLRCALRLHLCRRVMGDQALFIRRETLEQIGGIPDMPLMEEFEICRRLGRKGRLALATATVSTSSRRFTKLGVIRTYLRMWRVSIQYRLGTPAQRLRQIYEEE